MSERTVTLSDGGVWRHAMSKGTKHRRSWHEWYFGEPGHEHGPYDLPFASPFLTATDHRAIADVLDPPAVPPVPVEREPSEAMRRAIQHDRDELWCAALINVFEFGSKEMKSVVDWFEANRKTIVPSVWSGRAGRSR